MNEGYDAASGLVLDLGGEAYPAIPERPERWEAELALAKLKKLIATFPFVDDAARSVALAAILTGVCRPFLPTAPAFVFNAPAPASGKGLLADTVGVLATGRRPDTFSQAEDASEERKRLFAMLMGGAPVLLIDNVERTMRSAEFCAVLTQTVFSDRVLGASRTCTVPTAALWLVTGNNVQVAGDLTRRVLVCTIDARCERPDLTHFQDRPADRGARTPGRIGRGGAHRLQGTSHRRR